MQQRRDRSAARTLSVPRPGSASLLIHIIRGIYSDGMQIPALLCIGLTVALYYEKFPYHDAIAGLLIGSIVLIGLFRGCISWQQELGEYQRRLAMMRLQQSQADSDRNHSIPGFIPYTRR